MQVDLWVWRLDEGDTDAMIGHLSADERARADRYAFASDRQPFIIARARLRQILGEVVGKPGEELVFTHGEHGKPSLTGEGMPWFNFSDSGALGCLAVTAAGPVGVDIELMRPRDYLGMADRYFSAAECEVIEALPEAEHRDAFFRGWTRKEAFLKAVGSGLSTRLDAFDVTIRGDEAARVTRIDPSIDPELAAWSLHAFEPAAGYMGAIALRGGGGEMVVTRRS